MPRKNQHRLIHKAPRLKMRKRSPYYSIQYWDADGTEHLVSTGTSEKSAAEDVRQSIVRDLESIARGIVPESYTHKDTDPLSLVVAFQQHQEDLGNSDRYIRMLVYRVQEGLEFMQCGDLSALISHGEKKAVRYLRSLKRSAKTRDHYADSLKTFGIWLEKEGLIEKGRSPFANLPRIGKKGKSKLYARLTFEELDALIAVAHIRPVECWKKTHPNPSEEKLKELESKGLATGRCYLFAGYLGMRHTALKEFRWSDWDRKNGFLRVRKGVNRKTTESRDLPVSADPRFEEALEAEYLAQTDSLGYPPSPKDRIFQVPSKHNEVLRKDGAFLGMCDENGKRDVAEDSVMTWHGFRHSASTNNQQAGMPVALSMKLLGHKNLSTHQRYMEGHLNLADAGAALGRVMSGDVA